MSGFRGIVLGSQTGYISFIEGDVEQLEVGIVHAVTSYLLSLANLHAKSVICAYTEGHSCARLDAILLYHDMTSVDTIHLVDKVVPASGRATHCGTITRLL